MKSHNNVRSAHFDASFVRSLFATSIELFIPSYLKRPCPPSALLINYTIYGHKRHAHFLRKCRVIPDTPPSPPPLPLIDVLSRLPPGLQPLPHSLAPCLYSLLFLLLFLSFFFPKERCMNTTAVRRLSSTLSHLYKNIPKMAYQTRIIGVSFDSFVPHLFSFILSFSLAPSNFGFCDFGLFDVIRWQS